MTRRSSLILAGLLFAGVVPGAAQTTLPLPTTDSLPAEVDTALLRRLAYDTVYLQQVFIQAVSIDYPFPLVPLSRRMIAEYPQDLGVKRAVVSAFAVVRDWPNVLAFGQTVIEADSTAADTAYFRHLFAAYANLGQPSRIAAVAGQFVQRSPRDRRVLRSIYVALGDPDVRDWATVLAFGPTLLAADSAMADTAYFHQLFAAYARLGQLEPLAALTRRLVSQRDAHFPPPATLLRLAFEAFGDVQAWTHVVATGQELAAADSAIRGDRAYGFTMAAAYSGLRQPRKATVVLAELARRLPDDASVWLTYAQALRLAGLPRQASEATSRAFEVDRRDAHIGSVATWLWYAQELRRAGRVETARAALQRAAALSPNDPDVRREGQRIEMAARPSGDKRPSAPPPRGPAAGAGAGPITAP